MFNPIQGIMNAFGAIFSLMLLGGTFYGGIYIGVRSQQNPIAAPIVRSWVLGSEQQQVAPANPSAPDPATPPAPHPKSKPTLGDMLRDRLLWGG